MSYSIEVLPLTDTQIGQLHIFHISSLRKLQSQPERTGCCTAAPRALPIQAKIHKRQRLIHSIVVSRSSRIKGLMARQLTLQCQRSFFFSCSAENTLKMYRGNLLHSSQLENYSMLTWKKCFSINSFWTQSLVNKAQTKPTLVSCDLLPMAVGVTHTVWESAANNLHDMRRSITKVRMMTGVHASLREPNTVWRKHAHYVGLVLKISVICS